MGVLGAILAAAAVARWELLGARSLWFDEGYSLFVSGLGWRQIMQFLPTNDAHPPGYYLLLSAWRSTFGDDLAVLRLPSLFCGVASVAITWLLARKWIGPWASHLAALLVSINAFQVYASNELRMYMPLQLLVLLSTWALDRALCRSGPWWAAYGILAALATYFSYFAVLVLLPQVAWVLWRYRAQALRGLAIAGAVALVLYAPWLPSLPGFASRNPQLFLIRPAFALTHLPAYLLSILASHTFGGYLPNTVTYHRSSTLIGPYLLPLAPFVCSAFLGARRLVRSAGRLALVTWLGAVAGAATASLVAATMAAYPRNLVFLQPLAAITVAAGAGVILERVKGEGARSLGALVAMLLLGFPAWLGLGNLQSGKPEFDAFRYDQAARLVQQQFRDGDLLVYFPTGIEFAFGYYLRGPKKAVSLAARVEDWDPAKLRGLFSALRPHLQETHGRVWVMTSVARTRHQNPVDLVRLLWRAVEEAGYQQALVREFLGVQVALYQKAPRR